MTYDTALGLLAAGLLCGLLAGFWCGFVLGFMAGADSADTALAEELQGALDETSVPEFRNGGAL